MEVEPATAADCRAIAEVHVLSWQRAYDGVLPASYLASLSIDQREALWARSVASGRPEVLVARSAGRVVGFVAFGASRDQDANAASAEIWAIYLAPSVWSQGVGRALWLAAFDRIVAQGFASVTLWVIVGNERALRFYRSAGFEVEAGSEKEFSLGGVVLHEVRLRREAQMGGRASTSTIFETPRLLARHLDGADVDALHAVYGDREAMRFVGDGEPLGRERCVEWVAVTRRNYAQRGYGMTALVDCASGVVAGFCGLVHPGGQAETEIKYALRSDFHGRGLATEAVRAMLAYGARALGLARVIATIAPANLASQRVLLKAGLVDFAVRHNEDGSRTLVYLWLAEHERHINPDHFLETSTGRIWSDERGKVAWERAYEQLERVLVESGARGRLYVVCGLQGAGKTHWIRANRARCGPDAIFFDAALPSRKHRVRALALAQKSGAPAVAVWINAPLELALERNLRRREDERIPEETIRHVMSLLEPPSTNEGFAEVVEVDAHGRASA